jgi:drug/metabolite transporter (DMT)-like permease
MSDDIKGYLLGLVAVVFFGLTLPATRIAVAGLDPVFVGLGRAVIAAALAALILLATREPWPSRAQLARLALVAAGVVIGFPLFSAIAMQTAPAAHGGVVLGILPLATAVAGALFAGERPSMGFWLCGLVGAAAVTVFALWDGGTELHAADSLLLASMVSVAIGYAVGGDLSRTLGSWQVICWALIVSVPFTTVAAALTFPDAPAAVPTASWTAFFYVAVFSQLVGFFAWNAGLVLGGIARVGQTQLIQPFVTIAASALLLGETIGPRTIGFAAFVMAVVALGRKMRVTRRA